MQVDIVLDTVCPWCFIGKRRFERALAERPDINVDIRWRPFQLNPKMPREGMGRQEYMSAKFGGAERAGEIYKTIADAAGAEGLEIAFDRIGRAPNTLDSHRLIRWAATAGAQDRVVESLFCRYFLEGQDIGDRSVLADVALETGMDTELVDRLLASDADEERIVSEDVLARKMGISGVPFFIFEQKYSVSGAQEPAVFVQVLDLLQQEAAGTGSESETAPIT